MEFIVIMIVAVVTANSISDGSSTIQESKELKKIEQVVKPEAAKQEIARQEIAKQEAAKQEIAKQEAAKQEIAKQEVAKQEIVKQEKINQSTINSDSLIEKAVNFFSQYYLIGLILAAIAYVYFRTRKKITLREILNKEEFKPEPSVEPTTTEKVKSDSQSPESSDEEEEKK